MQVTSHRPTRVGFRIMLLIALVTSLTLVPSSLGLAAPAGSAFT